MTTETKTIREQIQAETKELRDRLATAERERDAYKDKYGAAVETLKSAGKRLQRMIDSSKSESLRKQAKELEGKYQRVADAWREAVEACNGDYAEARKKFPSAYAAFMDSEAEKKERSDEIARLKRGEG